LRSTGKATVTWDF